MAKSQPNINEIHQLLTRANQLIKKTKKDEKKPKVCRNCNEGKPGYRGLCDSCTETLRAERIDSRVGKRWFSTNGHEYCNNLEGKPTLYAPYRMGQIIGRPLESYEFVGRIDGDKMNNADHNLILVAKPGVNLSELKCECGRHYFVTGSGPLQLPLE